MLHTTIQKTDNKKFIEVSGELIEFSTPHHFNDNDAGVLKIRGLRSLIKKPLSFYTIGKGLTKSEQTYAYKLALYGRIHLDSNVQTAPIKANGYNFMNFESFRFLESLFDEKFSEYSFLNNIQRSADSFKSKLINELIKLWFRGYGLLPNQNTFVITDEILTELYLHKDKKHLSRFLSFVLKNIAASPVTTELPDPKIINKNKLMPSDESELNKWTELIKDRDTSLNKDLYAYLEFLLLRANNAVTRNVPTQNGKQVKKSYPQLKWGNFNLKSSQLRRAIPLLYDLGIFNIEQILKENALLSLYNSEQFKLLSTDEKQQTRNILREFVKYYCETNGIYLNINRIAPGTTKNRTTTYSENINFGDANILLDALFDDSNCLIDEKDIHQARVRRALLLQITTGARIHEVLLLKTDCLVTNKLGDTFIHFHKTKTDQKEHYVKVDSDMTEWINELQSISIPTPILVNSKSTATTFGDELEVPRLFTNRDGNNILLPSSINKFLYKLTKNLKLKSSFSSHDMRKIHALYLRTKGKDKVDIQYALNQADIDSLLPYLATKSDKVIENLKSVSLKGVWSHITEKPQSDSDIPLDTVLSRSSTFQSSAESKQGATNFLEKIFTEVNKQNRELPVHSENSPNTGMPMYSHNCTAAIVVNCGHTELDCFSCNKYLPDQDKLNEHKAEILRYLIQVLFYEAEAKKNKLEQNFILMNSKGIKEKLQKTFNSLFHKFKLNKTEAVKIEKNLNSTAKKYWKSNKALLSHPEALKLLLEKEL